MKHGCTPRVCAHSTSWPESASIRSNRFFVHGTFTLKHLRTIETLFHVIIVGLGHRFVKQAGSRGDADLAKLSTLLARNRCVFFWGGTHQHKSISHTGFSLVISRLAHDVHIRLPLMTVQEELSVTNTDRQTKKDTSTNIRK